MNSIAKNNYKYFLCCLLFIISQTTQAHLCSTLANRAKIKFSKDFTILTDTRNPTDWGAPTQGTWGQDIYYSVTLPDTMNLIVHNLGSQVYGTEISFYADTIANTTRSMPKFIYYTFLQQANLWQENYLQSQDCYILQNLPPGEYIFTIHGIPVSNASIVNGETQTTIIAWKSSQLSFPLPPPLLIDGMRQQPKEIGSFDDNFIYEDSLTTFLYADFYGLDGVDIAHHFSLSQPERISIAFPPNIGRAYLLDGLADCVKTFVTPGFLDIPEGNYWLILEAANDSPELHFSLQGMRIEENQAPSLESDITDNYITHRTFTDENGNNYIDETTFYDGLGRIVEQVQLGASPNGGDLVSLQTYDLAGRPSQEWSPIIIEGNNGSYVSPVDFINQAMVIDSHPYSLKEYEPSPLSRETRLTNTGSAWHSMDKNIETTYICNGSNENIVRFYAISDNGLNLCLSGNAPTGKFRGTRTVDEDGRTLEIYKDILGNVVLERRNDGTLTLDTYFVYDKYNQLRIVLPPIATNNLANTPNSWSLSDDEVIQQYGYVYRYDDHSRVSAKRLPGCQWQYFWYDQSGRLAFSQDGEQNKSNNCTFYLYDGFKREVMRGICDEAYTDDSTQRENLAVYTTTGALAGYSCDWFYEEDVSLLIVNYYDSYEFISDQNISSIYLPDTSDNSYQQIWKNNTDQPFANNMLTGKIVGHLPNQQNQSNVGEQTYSAYYYDTEGRPVQSFTGNHLGGFDKTYTSYDFLGNPIQQKVVHSSPTPFE